MWRSRSSRKRDVGAQHAAPLPNTHDDRVIMNGLIGRKLGMTRVFDAAGTHVPVTVIEAGPCPVISVADGRAELGFEGKKAKRSPKAIVGHVKKAGLEVAPRIIPRFAVSGEAPAAGTAGPLARLFGVGACQE